MYHITKATFTVIQKQSQQCNPRHLSAETFSVGGQLFDYIPLGLSSSMVTMVAGGPGRDSLHSAYAKRKSKLT